MEKRWMGVVVIGLLLAAGCAENARIEPGSDPAGDDGVSGAAGEAFAGSGGADGNDGTGMAGTGDDMRSEVCDPGKPLPGLPDAAMPTLDADGGANPDLVASGDDAGVDPEPNPTEPDAMPDSGTTLPIAPRTPRVHGEVIVTELMLDPTLLTDTVGEWIELHNTTSTDLELAGCTISDDRSDDFVLAPLLVLAGGYVVLGRTSQAAPVVDQVYSGMVLANTTDEVVITCGDLLIDRLAYGTGFPRHAGKTMQLDASAVDHASNDMALRWCDGVDAGTPGAANLPCPTE